MIEIRLSHTQWYFDPDRPLGRAGGFGEVYIGRSETGDEVAVKRLKLSAAEAAHRDLTIADHLGGKNLEYVIPVFDSGLDSESERNFVVMAKARKSLVGEIEDGVVEENRAVTILAEILSGLEEVPEIVHRDLKPSNILLHDDKWKIADFGIARFVEESTSP